MGSDTYPSLAAGLTAIVVGTLLGTLPVALSGVQGTRTGAPAVVLLRGLFGARLSYLPTAANIVQCVGWGVFEIVTIATAAHQIAPAAQGRLCPHRGRAHRPAHDPSLARSGWCASTPRWRWASWSSTCWSNC